MDTNDGIETVEAGETSQGVSIFYEEEEIDGVHESKQVFFKAAESSLTLRGTWDDNWAELDVTFSWSADGREFNCCATSYSAGDNGNKKGNAYMGFYSGASDWGEATLSENVHQNGVPVPISVCGTIPANQSTAVIKFRYIWDFSNAEDEQRITRVEVPFVPAPAITGPSGDIPDRQFTVTGTGARHNAVITLHSAVDTYLATGTITTGDNWTAAITLPNETQPLTFYARQAVGAFRSLNSNQKTVQLAVVPIPTITAPVSGPVPDKQFVVRGAGGKFDSGEITLYNDAGDAPLVKATISSNGSWTAPLTLPSETQPLTFYAKQKVGNRESGNSDRVTVQLATVPIPVITGPAAGSIQDTTFTVTGNQGVVGAKVQVHKDLIGGVVGESGALTGSNWSIPVTVPVGPASLVAVQIKDGRKSALSTERLFIVRPPALTAVNVSPSTETLVKFSGTGHTDATVVITKVSGLEASMPPPVQVTNGSWETTATNWPFDNYILQAIQKVPDNANGWIESLPYTFSVDRTFPDPTDVTHTADYQPTFLGKGYTGATVKLFNAGGGSTVAPDARVSNGQWSSRASAEWGPTLNREVHIKQYLDGQASPNWVILKVTIAPLAPTINAIPPGEDSPLIEGRCWPGAVVKLKYSDSGTEHQPVVTNGRWSHRREGAFAPGGHIVTVTQTAAQQTSPPASQPFTVFKPIPKPTIDPVGEETGRDLIVTGGNGMKDATLQLRDAQHEWPLGQPKLLTRDGPWSIELKGLEFRRYFIDAQQSFENRKSQHSEVVSFNVVLLSPVFEVPQPGGNLPRTSELSGTGMPGGRVEVWLQDGKEPLLKNIAVGPDGRWKAEVTLPIGVTTIRARQFFEDQTSRDSPLLTYNVVPAAPFIETPATDEHIGRVVVVSGFGVPGDTVTVKLGDAVLRVLGQSPVLEDRTWSLTLAFDQPGGNLGLVAVASCEGFESAASSPRSVVLGTYLPSIDVPAAGRWVSNPVGFEGQGRRGTGQLVSWFNPEQEWVPNIPVTATGWQGQSAQLLPPGGNWCRFKQTIDDGEDASTVSDWVESARFEGPAPASN